MGEIAVAALPDGAWTRAIRMLALALLALSNLGLAVIILVAAPAFADVATPLTGHIIGFGVTAAVALLVRRHTAAVLIAGTIAIFSAHVALSRWSQAADDGTPRASTASSSLSVVSINTWDAVDNVEQLRAYLATGPADVVVLSELGPEKQALPALLKAVYPYQSSCANRYDCSIALLSRVPFEAAGTVPYTKEMPAFVWARFAGALHVIGTHIYRPSRSPGLHARQTAAVARFIQRIDGPVVLAGDLNMSPWSYGYKSLKTQAGLKSARWLTPSWPAWPVVMPQVALDHILISQDLTFVASGTGPAVGSDHLPVFARIERQSLRTRGPMVGGSRLAAAGLHLDAELFADLGREHGGAGNLSR
ncbi:MAG: endonuclease/exonuclease/phosphatase family protein [Hyphomicrobiales bacterium]|nr:MAG: endonuclease/exonuclease/phosphatase family protein [Hyphomicrobiales bacterium]